MVSELHCVLLNSRLSPQVSRGAECVMVSKKLFTSNASDLTKKWIRHNVSDADDSWGRGTGSGGRGSR